MAVLLVCISVYLCACCLLRQEEEVGSPGSRVTDDCELQCECRELNLVHGRAANVPTFHVGPPLFKPEQGWV